MNEGISADEACKMRALNPEDFARMCNEDGSLKVSTETTTSPVKTNDPRPATVNGLVLQLGLTGFVLTVTLLIALLIKRKLQSKK